MNPIVFMSGARQKREGEVATGTTHELGLTLPIQLPKVTKWTFDRRLPKHNKVNMGHEFHHMRLFQMEHINNGNSINYAN